MTNYYNPSINHCSNDCPRRTAKCHSTCEQYAEDNKTRESIRQQRQAEALASYLFERGIKMDRLNVKEARV